MDRPLIFITNDDGIDAAGLHKLAAIASAYGDVVVGAPASPQSGKSSALTVNGALELISHPSTDDAIRMFSITGTPVDCVKVAMHALLDRRPDLILSGINHGSNAAVNNIYSCTMGAAMEGCIIGIPSIGFSLLDHSPRADFAPMSPFVSDIIRRVLEGGLPHDVCLNVNFPADCTPQGVKVVRAARGHWTEEYRDYTSPHGRPFFWLTGTFHNDEPDNPDTDEYWLKRGYGTIVPIRPDQTASDRIVAVEDMMA